MKCCLWGFKGSYEQRNVVNECLKGVTNKEMLLMNV